MIYDCFTFFNELDLLEIRLEELKGVVDRFVLVEATKTFSNRPKRLCYEENKDRFSRFHDRIIHIVVDDLPEHPKDSWENQFFQRNAISRGLVDCVPNDIVLISDVDEIPRAAAVAGFRGEIAFLEQNLYYYRLNCLCTTAKWAIPIMLRYRNLTTPQEVRMYWYDQVRRKEIPTIADSGWHFSYLGDVESIQLKLNSFSQQDFNTPEVNNRDAIEKKIDAAQDLFDRPQYQWEFVAIDESYPRIIYQNKFRYAHYIKGRDLAGTIFFDQYSRYKACADLLGSLLSEGETVLDMGSGVDCLLGEFLPSRDITFLDPLLEKVEHRPAYMIAGDALSPELDNRSFDYVVSIDALEHVPQVHRAAFIERLCTLARKGVILAFPASDAGDAVETDAWINTIYRTAYGKDYCWLDEHLQNGLPALEAVLAQFTSLGWQTAVRQNGHTPWMRELLSFTLCGFEVEGFRSTLTDLSAHFNRHLQAFDDTAPAYRQIVIATRGVESSLPDDPAVSRETALLYQWDFIRKQMATAPFQRLKEVSLLLQEKERTLERSTLLIAEKDRLNAELSKIIIRLEELASEQERAVAERDAKLAEQGVKIGERDTEVAAVTHRNAELLSSLSWRITGPARALADKILRKNK